ncbi:MAG: RICIN domain-containing protein [Demequina sp.]|nr:RICIN domain-containing protein [Demequina sp.]
MSILSKLNRRVAAVAAVGVFAALAGASASWGYWTTQGAATVTVDSADLTITTANFSTVSKTFGNQTLVGTGSVTVTNSTVSTSAQKGVVTLNFSAAGSTAALRGNFSFVVWLSTTANPCTDAATAGTALVTSNWNTGGSYTTGTAGAFSVGESRTYCVRTTIANPATAWPSTGTVTITPRVAGSIALGNYSGAATALTATQTTQYLFPVTTPNTASTAWFYIHRVFTNAAATNYCADLEGGDGPNGIGWPCKTGGTTNQSWGFEAVSGKAGYYTIRSNITAATVLQQNSTGVPVTSASFASGQVNQQWMLQQTATNYVGATATRAFYQIVNASTGQCLTYAAVNGTTAALNQLQMANCDGTASQQFLVVRTMFSAVNGGTNTVSCAYANPNFTVTFSAATPGMRYEMRRGTTVVSSSTFGAGGTGTVVVSFDDAADGAFDIYEDSNATGDAGTLVASGTINKGNRASSGTNACTVTGLGQ